MVVASLRVQGGNASRSMSRQNASIGLLSLATAVQTPTLRDTMIEAVAGCTSDTDRYVRSPLTTFAAFSAASCCRVESDRGRRWLLLLPLCMHVGDGVLL